jgi:hypothetical protein
LFGSRLMPSGSWSMRRSNSKHRPS